jgi:hypothetical protein
LRRCAHARHALSGIRLSKNLSAAEEIAVCDIDAVHVAGGYREAASDRRIIAQHLFSVRLFHIVFSYLVPVNSIWAEPKSKEATKIAGRFGSIEL